mgnify:FL=1
MNQTPAHQCAYVAFGANLGDPAAAFRFACTRIDALPRTRLVARSSLYRTVPIGVGGQPDYLNAVVAIETRLAPLTLLEALLAIEIEGGRTRPLVLAPRTLDLDLLLYGEQYIDEPELSVPHPRMHERAFVIAPLAEIAPDLIVPGRGPVAALLAGAGDQVVTRLGDG